MQVRARSADGPGPYAQSKDRVLVIARPGAVAKPTATRKGTNAVVLSWASTSGATRYEVSDGKSTKNVVGPATTATFDSLLDGTTYVYKVRSVSVCGPSPWSPTVGWTVDNRPGRMPPVTVTARACSIVLAWAPPSKNGSSISAYKVEVRT